MDLNCITVEEGRDGGPNPVEEQQKWNSDFPERRIIPVSSTPGKRQHVVVRVGTTDDEMTA